MSSGLKPKRISPPKPLTFLLKQLQSALRAFVDQALEPIDLTMAEAAILAELSVAPRRSNAELARNAFVTPQSMIAILRALEKRNLIVRRADPKGGRAMPAELTEQGAKQLLQFYLAMRNVEERLLGCIPHEEMMHLRDLLERCVDSLNAESDL